MAPEKWENDLSRELEGLDYLSKLFQGYLALLDEAREEYGDFLDSNLVTLIECLEYDVALTLNGEVTIDDLTIPGILKQLEDVADEVQVLQAGKEPKKGVTDEG